MDDKEKQIVIKLEIEIIRKVPVDWDKRMVEFFFNDSSHCISNEIAELHQANDAIPGCCDNCGRTHATYIRDASESDIAKLAFPVKEDFSAQGIN